MKKHLNDQLYDVISASIQEKRIEEGTLLLEGNLSELFSISRSPVRQALNRLCDDGLISTFEGRGYLVGTQPEGVIRKKLQLDVFASLPKELLPKKTETWQRVYNNIERELLYHSLFGSHRINELELSKYYGISRTISSQVLTRLQLNGLLERDERSRWQLLEWNEQRLNNLYEIRRRLEPYVLMRAAEHIPVTKIQLFIRRLSQAIAQYPNMESRQFDDLESDLHIRTLGYCPNREMLQLLQRTHSLLLSGKHILLDKTHFPEEEPFFQEHLEIFKHLESKQPKKAAESMEEHLCIAERKVSQRLAVFKENNLIADVPYLE
ncbi:MULTISPECIES: GntR family transcriptional regulator [Pseudomonas]|uniref:GntR family transcriptional regulator n=1 Tax=Pseudomonas TaxID=286 RepID=UPI0015A8CEAD|nr:MULTISPECIES: GntR family transcriptional regulator [Pseudomonas]